GYFFSWIFMYLIHEFWFVALAAADRIAICPSELICFASRSTSDVPIVFVSAWLMNRCGGVFPDCMSQGKEQVLMPGRCARCRDGQRADGSFAATTIASACAWMAAWIDGSCAAAVSCVPLLTVTEPPSSESAFSPPLSASTSYGFWVSFGM